MPSKMAAASLRPPGEGASTSPITPNPRCTDPPNSQKPSAIPSRSPTSSLQCPWDSGLGRTGNTHSGRITSAHQGRQAQGTGGETRGALSRASQRHLQGRDRGARLHCPGTSHLPTSALAKLICLSRSSGIIFPLEEKTEWVEK